MKFYEQQQLLVNNFNKRNIDVLWFNTFDEIKNYLLFQIPKRAKIGIGNSKTINNIGITNALIERGNIVYDKNLAKTKNNIKQLKRKALLSDYFISSANAIAIDGKIVNIDHSGNRVAAITYGPDIVYIVIGKNKITKTFDDAIVRAKNVAAPLNAKRAGYKPPCISVNECIDCDSPERICNVISIITGQSVKGRITILVANEEEGF